MAGFLLRSTRQIYSSSHRYILQPQLVVPVRFYAKQAASKAPNEMIKGGVFSRVKNKVDAAILVVRDQMNLAAHVIMTPIEGVRLLDSIRLKLVLFPIACKRHDPSKPGFENILMDAVEIFDKEIKRAFGEEVDKEHLNELLRLIYTTRWKTKGIQEIRTLALIYMDIFLEDAARPDVEMMLMDIIDKIEEEIKKPLTLHNKANDRLLKEFIKKLSPRFRLGMVKKDAREVVRVLLLRSLQEK